MPHIFHYYYFTVLLNAAGALFTKLNKNSAQQKFIKIIFVQNLLTVCFSFFLSLFFKQNKQPEINMKEENYSGFYIFTYFLMHGTKIICIKTF